LKRRAIKDCIVKEEVQFACIQEAKMGNVFKSLWGDGNIDWRESPAVNSAGRLLCMWSQDVLEVIDPFIGDGYLGIKGIWREGNRPCVIVNVYALYGLEEKKVLWDQLLNLNPR